MRTYPPEELARALHRRLTTVFWLHRPRVTVTLGGAGEDWWCEATGPDRRCRIACLDVNDAEFLIEFHLDDEDPLWGRTGSRNQTIEAVRLWLAGTPPAAVCERYPFVDAARRAFALLRAQVMACDPRMPSRVAAQIVHAGGDRHRLRFDGNDRSIHLAFYGNNPHPDATLVWHEFTIAETMVVDRAAFAVMVRAWLIDRAETVMMKRAFPWIIVRREAPGEIPEE